MSTRFARLLTLVGFFGLLGWVLLWHLWLSPHPDLNPWLLPVIWTVPLLFPLKGIVQGNPYTHAWGNFVLMPYFLHALTLITTDEGSVGWRWWSWCSPCSPSSAPSITPACVVGNLVSAFAKRKTKPTDDKRPARGVFYGETALSRGITVPLGLPDIGPAAAR